MTDSYWYKGRARVKPDKVVVKLQNKDGSFKGSVIMPTVYYPLPSDNFSVFTEENCTETTDPDILAAIDAVPYKLGFCYQNTEKLISELKKRGYSPVSYCGWLFTSEEQYPIHHCWLMLGDNLIDLADDSTAIKAFQSVNHIAVDDKESAIRLFEAFFDTVKKQNIPNSKRCYPVGIPASHMYYVGCPCKPEEGRKQYRALMQQFPHHEVERKCDATGQNETQKRLRKITG